MAPPFLISFFLPLLLFLSTCKGGTLSIDRNSCEGDKYSHIRSALENAIKWSDEAAVEMQRDEVNPRIAEKMEWLLGDDEVDHEQAAFGFEKIADIEIVDTDVFSEEWNTQQSRSHIAFVCNLDFLEREDRPNFPEYLYMDLIRRYPHRPNSLFVAMKKGGVKSIQMATSTGGDAGICDIIAAHPYYMGRMDKINWPTFTEERVLKTVNPSMRDKVRRWWVNVRNKDLWNWLCGKKALEEEEEDRYMDPDVPISLLWTHEFTVLHELTHARLAHRSKDQPKGACYGWTNSIACQEPKNADSLAWLALTIQLITKHGYDVTKDGKLKKI